VLAAQTPALLQPEYCNKMLGSKPDVDATNPVAISAENTATKETQMCAQPGAQLRPIQAHTNNSTTNKDANAASNCICKFH
jgi:hypothetical protein